MKSNIKDRSVDDLLVEVGDLRKKLFNLRLHMAAGQVKDYAQFKRLRADIARALTLINQRCLGSAGTSSPQQGVQTPKLESN